MTKSRKNIIIALLIGLIGSIVMLVGINMQPAKKANAEDSLSIEFTIDSADFLELIESEKAYTWSIGDEVSVKDYIVGKYLLFDLDSSWQISFCLCDSNNSKNPDASFVFSDKNLSFYLLGKSKTISYDNITISGKKYGLFKVPYDVCINVTSRTDDLSSMVDIGKYYFNSSCSVKDKSGNIYYAKNGLTELSAPVFGQYDSTSFELNDEEKNTVWLLGDKVEKNDNISGKYLAFSEDSLINITLYNNAENCNYDFLLCPFDGSLLFYESSYYMSNYFDSYETSLCGIDNLLLVKIPEKLFINVTGFDCLLTRGLGFEPFFAIGEYSSTALTINSVSGDIYYVSELELEENEKLVYESFVYTYKTTDFIELTDIEKNLDWQIGSAVQVGDKIAGKYIFVEPGSFDSFTFNLVNKERTATLSFSFSYDGCGKCYFCPLGIGSDGYEMISFSDASSDTTGFQSFFGDIDSFYGVLVHIPESFTIDLKFVNDSLDLDVPLGEYIFDSNTTVLSVVDSKYNKSYYAEGFFDTLSTPQLTVINGGVNVSEVENASGYTYVVNGGAEQMLATAGSIALNNGDTIKVKANGSEYYADSEYTETYTYYNVRHPALTVDRYGVASWDSIENATSYEVYVNNELKTTINSCTYTLTDGQTIKVKSVRTAAENELVYISDNVEEVTYTKETLATPVVKIDKNGLVTWNVVTNAQKYIIQLLGVYEVETAETSYQLYGGNIVSIKAVGDSNLYNDSEYSERLSYSLTLPNDLREVKVGDDISGKTLYILDFGTTYSGLVQFLVTEQGYLVYCPLALTEDSSSYVLLDIDSEEFADIFRGFDIHDKLMLPLPDGMGVVTELNYDIKAYVSASEMGDPIDSGNISDTTVKENTIGKRLTTIIGLTAGMAVVAVCGLVFIPKKKKHR